MQFLDNITHMLNVLLIVLIILAVVFFTAIFIMRRQKKGRGLEEHEGVDYSQFERADAEDYVKLDDIRDGMIICDGGYRFVAAIKARGFDFYHASSQTQSLTQQGFVGFVNTISKPIMYRQYSQAVNMDYTLSLYQKAYQKVELQLFEVGEEIRDINNALRRMGSVDESQSALYEQRMEQLQVRQNSLEWRKAHIRDEIAHVKRSSGGNVAPLRMQTWVFDWTYDEASVTVKYSKEQIYKKALHELEAMASGKIRALAGCNVRASRCTTEDLIEMVRRHSSPISANRFRMRDILKSSYFDDINTETNHGEMMDDALFELKMQGEEEVFRTLASEPNKQKVETKRNLMPKNLKNIGVSSPDTEGVSEKVAEVSKSKPVVAAKKEKKSVENAKMEQHLPSVKKPAVSSMNIEAGKSSAEKRQNVENTQNMEKSNSEARIAEERKVDDGISTLVEEELVKNTDKVQITARQNGGAVRDKQEVPTRKTGKSAPKVNHTPVSGGYIPGNETRISKERVPSKGDVSNWLQIIGGEDNVSKKE